MKHTPNHNGPHVLSWRPPRRGPLFNAVAAALLQRTELRLQSAKTPAERLKLGGDFWLVADRAERHDALHVANTLDDICRWAQCPMPQVRSQGRTTT